MRDECWTWWWCGAAGVWTNTGNHVEMWLQAPLRDQWAQGDVNVYEVALTLCVVGNSCTDFKQQGGGGRRVGWEQIRWPSCDASCWRSGLALCRKATLPSVGEGDRASICHWWGIVLARRQSRGRCAILRNQWLGLGQDERVLLSVQCARG